MKKNAQKINKFKYNPLKPGDLVLHTSDSVVGVVVDRAGADGLEDFLRVLCEDGTKIWSRYNCKLVSDEANAINKVR
tara:strand:+ start:117 stop:347 length:231 start_codon:yes stop_codon:yes gene_type:complete